MFNNKLLDWQFDNGITIGLLADPQRNRFYDRMLSRTVKDKNCVDIGFGTGLLSFLAIKHGARHVTAFEINYERFLLGQYLIEKMELQDRITLHNLRFESGFIPDNCELIFQEIFDQEFWADGLAFCVAGHTLPVLPGRYRTEFFICEITEDQCQHFLNPDLSMSPAQQNLITPAIVNALKNENKFKFYNQSFLSNSGAQIIDNFQWSGPDVVFANSNIYLNEIQECLNEFLAQQKIKKIHPVINIENRILDNEEYAKLLSAGTKIAEYEFDYTANTLTTDDYQGKNTVDLDRSKMFLDMTLPADPFKNKMSILLTVHTIAHDELELVISQVSNPNSMPDSRINKEVSSTWALPMNHSIFIDPVPENQKELKLRQYLDNGVTRFWYES